MKLYLKKISIFSTVILLAISFTNCKAVQNSNNKQRGAVIGATGGAILGAIIGNNVGKGGNGELGAVIGGVVGGGAGILMKIVVFILQQINLILMQHHKQL